MKKKSRMKSVLFLTALLLLESTMPFLSPVYAAPEAAFNSDSEAEAKDPVTFRKISIGSEEELLQFAKDCTLDTWSHGVEVSLTADLDMSEEDFEAIPTFGGIFEGNGHTIRGLLINKIGSAKGFFRYIQTEGVVRNLNLEGVVLSNGSGEQIGGLAGINYGRIEGCSFSGTILAQSQTGGIAGLNEATGIIISSRMDGDVSGDHFTGGIAGKNLGTISSCTNNSNVNTNNPQAKMNLEDLNIEQLNSTENLNSNTDTGRITGYSSGIVENCSNLGPIGYSHTGYNVGGIAGRQNGFLSGCSNQAAVLGRKDVGGIVGQAEPYLIMEYSEDKLQQLDSELDKMHDIINNSATHFTDNTSAVSTQLDTLTGNFRTAGDSVHTVMNSVVEFTNGSMGAVNDAGERIGDLTDGADNMLGELHNSSAYMKQATAQMQEAIDKLQSGSSASGTLADKVKQIMDLLSTDSNALSTASSNTTDTMDSLSASRTSLGTYADTLKNAVTGSTLSPADQTRLLGDITSAQTLLSGFDSMYPAVSQKATDAVSSISSYMDARSTALSPLAANISSSSISAAANSMEASKTYAQKGISQIEELKVQIVPCVDSLTQASDLLKGVSVSVTDPGTPPSVPVLSDALATLQNTEDTLNSSLTTTDTIIKLLNELIPYFEQSSDITAASIEYMKQAFASMTTGFSHVDNAVGTMQSTVSGMAQKPDITFPAFNSSGSAAIDTLFDSVSSAADTISLLNNIMKGLGDTAADDIKAINDQLQVILQLLIDVQNDMDTTDADDIIEDVSDTENYEHKEGKIANCSNNGAVEGDIDIGGIVGMMAQEYDFDPEDDINNIGKESMNFKYKTRAVAASCINRGKVTSKKDQLGGIVGRMDLGSVIQCQNYGAAESESGNYIGGIAGFSSSVIKNCYSLCSLSGSDHIGGIAGDGTDIQDCYSMVTIDSDGEALGAVAGSADGEIVDNYYVSDGLAGIDGIDYAGSALSLGYELFSQTAGLPSEFKILKLSFVADGKMIANLSVNYGASLSPDQIPEVPPKDGFYASWPDFNFSRITASATLEAEYIPWVTVISSEMTRADSGLPVFLAEGEFTPDATINVVSLDENADLPADRNILEAFHLSLNGLRSPDTKVHIRYLPSDSETTCEILVREKNQWEKVPFEEDGSYLIFTAGRDAKVAIVEKPKDATVLLLIIIIVAAVLIVLLTLGRKKKLPFLHTGHRKKRTAEEYPHTPDTD